MAIRATRCPCHNFINLQVIRASQKLVKDIIIPLSLIFQTHSATGVEPKKFQELTGQEFSSLNKESRDITLAKGELLRLPSPKLSHFSVGNKEVLKAKALGSSALLLRGEKLGHADLLIWSKGNTRPKKLSVFVVRKSKQLKLMQLTHGLSSLGLKVNRRAGVIRLSGTIETYSQYLELVQRFQELKDRVQIDDVKLSLALRRKVFSKFLVETATHNLGELNCRPLKLFIRCEASQALQKEISKLNELFLIDWISEGLLQATRQYQVTLILQQFENSKGDAFNFGLSKIEGNLSALILSNPLALIEKNPISLKDETFRSQTLAHPIIKGRLNFPIKIRIGQQIPFLQSVSNGVATQQWRFAGLSMDVSLAPFSNRLKVNYKTNLSRPRGGGISENLQESTLLIPINKTVVLFDIGFQVNQKDLSKLPGISQVPLFGSLFKGEANHNSYKKILCLITIEEI
jgi:hypothetical protein